MLRNSDISVLFIGHTYLIGQSQKKLEVLARTGVCVGLLAPANWVDKSQS